MSDWKLPDDLDRAKELLNRGYSIGAVAMQFGANGSEAYYNAYKALGFSPDGRCPYCGTVCMGLAQQDYIACQKDAERYRWLRDKHGLWFPPANDWYGGEDADEAIDAAMKEQTT